MSQKFDRGNVSVKLAEDQKVNITVGADRSLELSLQEMNDLIEAASELRSLVKKDRALRTA